MVSRIDEVEARIAAAGRQPHKRLTVEGYEVPDPTPVAVPTGVKRVDNITRRIREVLQSERMRAEALEGGMETFEEADDFDVGDEAPDPHTVYEDIFDPPPLEEVAPVEKKVDRKKKKKENPPVDDEPEENEDGGTTGSS